MSGACHGPVRAFQGRVGRGVLGASQARVRGVLGACQARIRGVSGACQAHQGRVKGIRLTKGGSA